MIRIKLILPFRISSILVIFPLLFIFRSTKKKKGKKKYIFNKITHNWTSADPLALLE